MRSFRRVCAALALFGVLVVADEVVLLAQTPVLGTVPSSVFAACIRNSAEFGDFDDHVSDIVKAEGIVLDVRDTLKATWTCSLQYGNDELVPLALPVFISIALIMVVWTGVRMMFAGSVDIVGNLGFILMLLFGYGLLDNYYSATPIATPFGMTRGIAHAVSGGGIHIAQEIFAHGDSLFLATYDKAKIAIEERRKKSMTFSLSNYTAKLARNGIYCFLIPCAKDYYGPYLDRITASLGSAIQWLFLGILWLIYWILTAQYLWGFVVVAVLSLIGPLFIPFLLVPQLDWLFWGWLKGLVNGAVHMIVSACIFVVAAILLVLPMERLAEITAPTRWEGGPAALSEFLLTLGLSYFPAILLAGAASLAVGSLSQSIVSGSAPAASGLFSRAASVVGGAATALSPFSVLAGRRSGAGGGGGGAGDAGAQPLSQVTDPRMVAGAAAQARAQAGLPPSGGPGPSSAGGAPSPPPSRPQSNLEVELRQSFGRIHRRFEQFQKGEISPAQYLGSVNEVMNRAGRIVRSDLQRHRTAWQQLLDRSSPASGPGRKSRPSSGHVPQP